MKKKFLKFLVQLKIIIIPTYLLSQNTFCKELYTSNQVLKCTKKTSFSTSCGENIFEEKLGYNNFIWPRLEQEKKVVGKKRLRVAHTNPTMSSEYLIIFHFQIICSPLPN